MAVFVVSSGQTSHDLTLSTFDQLKILSGGAVDGAIVGAEANLFVNSGGTVSGAEIYSGGGDFVTGDAVATIVRGGWEVVQAGTASGSKIYAGGAELLAGGGTLYDAALYAGADQHLAGGIAYATTVGSGAVQFVSAGSIASGTVVESGGFEQVFSGGIASATQVESGGTLIVLPGGVVSSASIAPGGAVISTGIVMDIYPAGVMLNPGLASGLSLSADDADYVLTGGVSDAAMITSGAVEYLYAGGIASATRVIAGGTEKVSGGVAYGTFVFGADGSGHSLQNVVANGIASATVVGPGGAQNISGGTAFATLLSGGAQFVEAGAVSNTIISAGGYQFIAGGSAVSTILIGGSENVSGGTAYATTVNAGGYVTVAFGGTLSGLFLAGNGDLGPNGAALATTIANSGVLTLNGGTATGTIIGSGGAEILGPNTTYPIAISEDFGTMIEAGGAELVGARSVVSNVTIAGALGFISGGTASGSITFESGGQLFVEQDLMPAAVISAFSPGDGITFAAITSAAGDRLSASAGLVMISAGGTVYDLKFADRAPGQFALGADAQGRLTLLENPPCFSAGTRILTLNGSIAVENLLVGDRVITLSGRDAPIIWCGKRRLDIARHPRPEQVRPIRITADALADGVPARDLIVSPDHALFIDDILIPAKSLINGRNVTQVNVPSVTYHHIELAAHAIIFAENCAAESYLETGNRGAFDNASGAVTLHPDFAQTLRESQSCAPFVDSGPKIAAVAARLLRRYYAAEARRHFAATITRFIPPSPKHRTASLQPAPQGRLP